VTSIPNATHYIVDYSENSDFSPNISDTLPYGTTIKNFSNLTPGMQYYFRVKACNSAGCSGYDTASQSINFANTPVLQGEDALHYCAAQTYTCHIDNPHLYTCQWSCNAYVTIVSQNGNSVTVTPASSGAGTITVQIYVQGQLIQTLSKNITVTQGVNISPVPFTIIANTSWANQNHMLSVSATVPSGVTLTITGKVYCSENAKIIVQPGGKLIIDGDTLTSACDDEMWQGNEILVNHANTTQYRSAQGSYVKLTRVGNIQFFGFNNFCDLK
jgi:hypothetical protein